MENYKERKDELISLGFEIDEVEPFPTWNHENGAWICDFALEQYDAMEWDGFINEFYKVIK